MLRFSFVIHAAMTSMVVTLAVLTRSADLNLTLPCGGVAILMPHNATNTTARLSLCTDALDGTLVLIRPDSISLGSNATVVENLTLLISDSVHVWIRIVSVHLANVHIALNNVSYPSLANCSRTAISSLCTWNLVHIITSEATACTLLLDGVVAAADVTLVHLERSNFSDLTIGIRNSAKFLLAFPHAIRRFFEIGSCQVTGSDLTVSNVSWTSRDSEEVTVLHSHLIRVRFFIAECSWSTGIDIAKAGSVTGASILFVSVIAENVSLSVVRSRWASSVRGATLAVPTVLRLDDARLVGCTIELSDVSFGASLWFASDSTFASSLLSARNCTNYFEDGASTPAALMDRCVAQTYNLTLQDATLLFATLRVAVGADTGGVCVVMSYVNATRIIVQQANLTSTNAGVVLWNTSISSSAVIIVSSSLRTSTQSAVLIAWTVAGETFFDILDSVVHSLRHPAFAFQDCVASASHLSLDETSALTNSGVAVVVARCTLAHETALTARSLHVLSATAVAVSLDAVFAAHAHIGFYDVVLVAATDALNVNNCSLLDSSTFEVVDLLSNTRSQGSAVALSLSMQSSSVLFSRMVGAGSGSSGVFFLQNCVMLNASWTLSDATLTGFSSTSALRAFGVQSSRSTIRIDSCMLHSSGYGLLFEGFQCDDLTNVTLSRVTARVEEVAAMYSACVLSRSSWIATDCTLISEKSSAFFFSGMIATNSTVLLVERCNISAHLTSWYVYRSVFMHTVVLATSLVLTSTAQTSFTLAACNVSTTLLQAYDVLLLSQRSVALHVADSRIEEASRLSVVASTLLSRQHFACVMMYCVWNHSIFILHRSEVSSTASSAMQLEFFVAERANVSLVGTTMLSSDTACVLTNSVLRFSTLLLQHSVFRSLESDGLSFASTTVEGSDISIVNCSVFAELSAMYASEVLLTDGVFRFDTSVAEGETEAGIFFENVEAQRSSVVVGQSSVFGELHSFFVTNSWLANTTLVMNESIFVALLTDAILLMSTDFLSSSVVVMKCNSSSVAPAFAVYEAFVEGTLVLLVESFFFF